MKATVSLHDGIFQAADDLAAKRHVSRSQLYVMVLERFLHEHDRCDITRLLDAWIEADGQPVDPRRLVAGRYHQRRSDG